MNILLINHYAGSPRHGMEFRPYYLAREWLRLGHQVRIVAADHSHLRQQAPALRGAPWLDETLAGIAYRWYATPAYRGNGVGRVRNMLAFVARLYRDSAALASSPRPDLVIASSTYPLDIWPARRIARLAGARLVHEIHDLWPLSPIELGGMSRYHPFIVLLQAAEDYACRHADSVISVLPKVASHLQSRGLDPTRLHIVPNGADPADWQTPPAALPGAVAALLYRLRQQGMAILGYAGSHGLSNALDQLLDAAMLMRGERCAFVLVGDGPAKAALQLRAQLAGLEHVYFLDPVGKAAIPALLQQFDIAFLGWHRHSLYRFGISPNKLLDYMMAARPVLHAVAAANDLVTETGCGISVAPATPLALADGARALLALEPSQRAAMGQRGRRHVLEQLTYPVLARRFLDACATLPAAGVSHVRA